jgi:hypothetical protein
LGGRRIARATESGISSTMDIAHSSHESIYHDLSMLLVNLPSDLRDAHADALEGFSQVGLPDKKSQSLAILLKHTQVIG